MSDPSDTRTDHDADTEAQAKVAELVGKARVALVTTTTADGSLTSRPLAVLASEDDFNGELFFFTPDPSPKTEQVRDHHQVNVGIQVDDSYCSISGTAEITRDQAKIDELWNVHAAAGFDQGRDDPAVALLHVRATSAQYWTVDSPKLVAAAKYAKALVTGEQPDIGENRTVEL